jgi:DNA-directed RNA polymerase specialized sigma24 family protein
MAPTPPAAMQAEPPSALPRQALDALPGLVRYIRRSGASDDEARDIVQSALVAAWSALRDGHRPDNLRAWLYRLAHNAMIDRRRRESLWKRLAPRLALGAASPAPARNALEAVQALPHPYRAILLLRFVEGLTHLETAEVLDMPPERVMVYAGRALKRVAKLLQSEER